MGSIHVHSSSVCRCAGSHGLEPHILVIDTVITILICKSHEVWQATQQPCQHVFTNPLVLVIGTCTYIEVTSLTMT